VEKLISENSSLYSKKKLKCLEITRAYALDKLRHVGDIDGDLVNWSNNLMILIQNEKNKIHLQRKTKK
jgi:hypothetical protein